MKGISKNIFLGVLLVLAGIIFLVQQLFNIPIGSLFIALLFAFIQHKYHLIKLDAATYYVPYIPIDISVGAVLIINSAVFILCLAALLIPGRIIAKHVSPVEAIRFE